MSRAKASTAPPWRADDAAGALVFEPPLVPATLRRRRMRFLADVTLEGEAAEVYGREATAHCTDTGRMTGLLEVGSRVWLSRRDAPGRKLPWTWELASFGAAPCSDAPGAPRPPLVCVDTQLANHLAAVGARGGHIAPLAGYASVRAEVRRGKGTRLDLLLEGHPDDPRPCWVEVKSANLRVDEGPPRGVARRVDGPVGRGGTERAGGAAAWARFPDGVTERGRKHLGVLADAVAAGHRAVALFLSLRGDVEVFGPAWHIDSAYGDALVEAREAGVELVAWRAAVTPERVTLGGPLPVDLTA